MRAPSWVIVAGLMVVAGCVTPAPMPPPSPDVTSAGSADSDPVPPVQTRSTPKRSGPPAPSAGSPTSPPSPRPDAPVPIPLDVKPPVLLPHPPGTPKLEWAFRAFVGNQGRGGDSSLAVSNDTIVAMDYNQVGIFLRNGSLIASKRQSSFYANVLPPNESIGDPRVAFDADSQRFFAVGASGPLGGCIPDAPCANTWTVAVSKSASPRSLAASDWYFWGFDATLTEGEPSGMWGDYSFVQFDPHLVVITGQMLKHTAQGPISTYDRIWVFNKSDFVLGRPIAAPTKEFYNIPDPATGEVLINRFIPASKVDASEGIYLVHHGARDCDLVVGHIAGDAANAALTVRNIAIAGTCRANMIHARQLGGGPPISIHPHILSSPVHQGNSLWVSQVVPAHFASGDVNAVRLVRLEVGDWPSTPTIAEDSLISEEGASYAYPAIVVSRAGDLAIVMNRLSATTYPSGVYTGRLAGDPEGSFRPLVTFAPGLAYFDHAGSGSPIGFADFSTAVLDPSGDSAWFIVERGERPCVWGEIIAQVSFVDGGVPDAPPTTARSGGDGPCPPPTKPPEEQE